MIMRRFLLLSSLAVMFICLTACSSKRDELIKEYITIIGSEPQVRNNVYDWINIGNKAIQSEKKLKEKTDKLLSILPNETHNLETSAEGELYSSYIWETKDLRVVLWIDYKKDNESIQLVYSEK